jgi:peptide/nickel transport system ATP-binding protein
MVGVPNPVGRLEAYSYQLSGGLRQRAMIAMALAGSPRLLIADEPTTALDVTTQAQILELLRQLQQQLGMAIMLITHDLGVIAEMADHVAVMYLGKVVEQAPVDRIFHAPQHPYTRALLRSIPDIAAPARVKLPTIQLSLPHPFNRPSGCPFHPRCPDCLIGLCDTQEPSVEMVDDAHHVSCLRHSQLTQSNGGLGRASVPGIAPPERSSDIEVLLDVRHLRKSFTIYAGLLRRPVGEVRAVDDASFTLKQGETLALVGESGCGKTTMARCILRAVAPTAGQILFRTDAGTMVDVAKLSEDQMRPLRRQMQMVFQDPYASLNPRMNILDIVGEPLLVNGVKSRRERADRVEQLLRTVGLRPEYMRRYPHAFSGGQRQRIGIARALALRPKLVVADEPVSALDVSVQAQILNLLLDLQSELALTYLFVAHNLSVVRHISDRVAVMYVGQIVEMADRETLFNNPKHPYTAALMAAVPKPDPRLRGTGFLKPPEGEVANPAAPPDGCYFHPRCPFADEACRTQRQIWQEIEPGHFVRCHRANELHLRGISTVAAGAAS